MSTAMQRRTQAPSRARPKVVASSTPSCTRYLDETGAIARDRIFAIGVLSVGDPAKLHWTLNKLRNAHNFHISSPRGELKFSHVRRSTLGFYTSAVDAVLAQQDCRLGCFIVDRHVADPIARYGTYHDAYARVAAQLLISCAQPHEIATVIADAYSAPNDFDLEAEIKNRVNARLSRRLAINQVIPMDSRSCDGLQLVDVLTGAVAYEFRAAIATAAGQPLADSANPKSLLAEHVRRAFEVTTCLPELPHGHDRLSVRVHLPAGASSLLAA